MDASGSPDKSYQESDDTLAALRGILVEKILKASIVLGGITAAVALADELASGRYGGVALYLTLYFLIICAAVRRQLPYALRAGTVPFVLYALAILEFWLYGVHGNAPMFLFGFVVFAGMLLGLRAGATALALSIVSVCVIAGLYIEGILPRNPTSGVFLETRLDLAVNPMAWLVMTLLILFIAVTTLLSLTALLRRLNESALSARALVAELRDEVAERHRSESGLRRAEEALRVSEEHLRAILDSTDEGIIVVDEQGKHTHTNRRFAEMWRIPQELIEQADDAALLESVLVQLEDPEAFITKVQQLYGSTEDDLDTLRFKDGRVFERRSCPLMRDGRVAGRVWGFRDIAERIRLEELMIQSERMLSVGGLAAGMAHEINNPLAGIMQNVQNVQRRLTSDLPANDEAAVACGTDMTVIRRFVAARQISRMLDTAMDCGRRASGIVNNMLSFAHKGARVSASQDIAELLDRTVDLAANDYDLTKSYDFRTIEIVREYDATTPRIPCESSKIQQVLLNLLKNGADAMRGNGPERPPRFTLRVLPDGNAVRVEVEDSGAGMDEATRKRAFEPFFTTKDVGVGTGLGLSVSYFIVTQNHGGTMTLESAPGVGTTVVVLLPLDGKAL
jgi:PAS domain S-box-containing protein